MDTKYFYKLGDVVAYHGKKTGSVKQNPIPVVITQTTEWVDFNGVHRYYSIANGQGFNDTFINESDLKPGGNIGNWPGSTTAKEVFVFATTIKTIVAHDEAVNPMPATSNEYSSWVDSMPAYQFGEKED